MTVQKRAMRQLIRRASRSIFRTIASWPVSGLTSLDLPPSHDCSQWHDGKPSLDDRCGGSAGFVIYLKTLQIRDANPPYFDLQQRTCFPFNLTAEQQSTSKRGAL